MKAIFFGCVALCLGATACASTGGGGGGVADTSATGTADTTGTKTDTGSAGDTTAAKTDTGSTGGDSSSVGAEKNIVELQKASATCPTPNPASFGEALGVTIRNAIVTSPGRDEGKATPATLIGLFVQQKNGGQWSGMYVTGKKSDELSQVKVGDVITMTGDVKDFYCFTEIYSKVTTIESQGKELPVALTVTTSDLSETDAVKSEPYEGVLVQLHDVVVGEVALGSDGKDHGDVYVGKDDKDKAVRMGSGFYGVYMSDKNKDGTYTAKYPKGTKLGTVTGVVEYSFNAYRLVITKDPEGVVKP